MKEFETKKTNPVLKFVLNVLLALIGTVAIFIALNVLV